MGYEFRIQYSGDGETKTRGAKNRQCDDVLHHKHVNGYARKSDLPWVNLLGRQKWRGTVNNGACKFNRSLPQRCGWEQARTHKDEFGDAVIDEQGAQIDVNRKKDR